MRRPLADKAGDADTYRDMWDGARRRGAREPGYVRLGVEGMDIGKCFRDAWGLFTKDLGPLIVTAIIGSVLIGVVAAVAIGPSLAGTFASGSDGDFSGLAVGSLVMGAIVLVVVSVLVNGWQYATLYGMLLGRVRQRRAAEYGDMTGYFGLVGPMILATIVLGIIIGIGYTLLIIPGLLFTTWWLLTLVIMVDQGVGLGEAMSQSKALAQGVGYMAFFGVWIVGAVAWSVLNMVLGVIPFVGTIISLVILPLALAYTVSMYFQARGEGHLIDEALGLAPATAGPAMAPLPPAPPAYAPATPPVPNAYQPAAAPPPAAGPRVDDAWKAAADPLAVQPRASEAPPAPAVDAAPPAPAADVAPAAPAPDAPAMAQASEPQEPAADKLPEPPAPPAPPAPEPPAAPGS